MNLSVPRSDIVGPMRLLRSLLFFILSTLGVRGNEIVVVFDVNVYAEFDVRTLSYNQNFLPRMVPISLIFDDRITAVQGDSTRDIALFGTATVKSPLTAQLPFGPGDSAIDPNTFALISAYDFGPGQAGSRFSVVRDQTNYYQNDERFFSYFLTFNGPQYPPIADVGSFSGSRLQTYLRQIQLDGGEFYFSEMTTHFDVTNHAYLGGVGYTGLATVRSIHTLPEPAATALLVAFVSTVFIRRRAHRG